MEKIIIIGAGLVGSLQALYLAKKGHTVEVYERRNDIRKQKLVAGRSINLALSNRGWKALKRVGINTVVEKTAIPMYGRIIHDTEGNTTYQPYGLEKEAIYSVSRGGLNQLLIEEADKLENVSFFFEHRCLDIDVESNTIIFENDTREIEVKGDRIFATDGAFSAIRARLQKRDRFNYQQFYLPHGYKELTIPAGENGSFLIEKNALHIWPRGNYMLIALGNNDGSFTCTLFFPFEGEYSFESLKTEDEIDNFFKNVFPDAYELIPNLSKEYQENPTASLVTVRCEPWNYEDKVLLMGDASHAIVPFYGQGMNSGFEDCSIFDDILEDNNLDFNKAIPEFAKTRKKDADAISELALRNFIEMRDLVADESFLLRKKIEKKIFEKHPNKWMPLYSQVTFSHIPYSEALNNGLKQEKIMDKIMAKPNIESLWDSQEVEDEILSLSANA